MNPRATLIDKLNAHPELAFSEAQGVLRIEAPCANGFAVELRDNECEWTVYLGNAGFHESFANPGEALEFIAWCYSGQARIREVWRGKLPQKAVLEAETDGNWRAVSETGMVFVPFWRHRREVILSNPCLLAP